MLTRLFLRNFQKHGRLAIRFDRITSIVGESDAGKSAVVRALRLICRNKPNGASHIRHGAKQSRIVLTVDGKKIKRIRGKTKNEYHIGSKVLRAFGATVPQPVERVLQITDDNFQGQHDAPYWLSFNAGQFSKALNDVVDLETIDATLAYVSQRQRQAKTSVNVAADRLRDAKADRDRLRAAVRMDKALRHIAELTAIADAADDRRESLKSLVSSVLRLRQTVRTCQTMSTKMDAAQVKAGAASNALQKHMENVTALRGLIAAHEDTTNAKRSASELLANVEYELSKIKRCPTCQNPMS